MGPGHGAADDRATAGAAVGEPDASDERAARVRRFAWWMLALGLATRLPWALWVHPAPDFVFSDMAGYVQRAELLAAGAIEPGQRELVWQAYGTHFLIALPLRLFGRSAGIWVAAAMWGLLGGLCVPLGYLLAARVITGPHAERIAIAVGASLLLWVPLWMGSGWFLSEVPFCCFQLAAVWGSVALLQGPARPTVIASLGVGAAWALTIALRPQAALALLFVLATLALTRSQHRVDARAVLVAALPVLLVVGFSSWRFHRHTGRWAGVAENAAMNLTAGRCHNVVTLGDPTPGTAARMVERHGRVRSRRVSLPGYRVLGRLPPAHPMALRPALGETIRVPGYIGDPDLHRQIRARCYAATGVVEQLRYSVVNASLLWFYSRQWPISADRDAPRLWFALAEFYRGLFAIAVWIPSWIGVGLALRRLRSDPGAAVVASQLVVSVIVAAVFFGTVRLRTPYDPYALILAALGWRWIVSSLRRRT